MGAVLCQLPCKVIFGRFYNFLLFMSAQAIVSAQNPAKINLHGNCHITAPIRATKVPKVPQLSLSYKMHFPIKCIVVALDEVEVKI